jgi:hypothetical protein
VNFGMTMPMSTELPLLLSVASVLAGGVLAFMIAVIGAPRPVMPPRRWSRPDSHVSG